MMSWQLKSLSCVGIDKYVPSNYNIYIINTKLIKKIPKNFLFSLKKKKKKKKKKKNQKKNFE